MSTAKDKMQVEIWSDIMCPFCYIGKRKFEKALALFANKENIELVWKSFQLSPDLKSQPDKNIYQYLAEHKGMSLENAKQTINHVTNLAAQVGLVFNFDTSVLANSFDAHRFLHLAKKYHLQNEAEEKLFAAYFTDGKDFSDHETLQNIGISIGLNVEEIKQALNSNQFAQEVQNDILEAQQIGVRGVPFFVFNRKYAVSGAQETSIFLETIQKSFIEWQKENQANTLEITEGETCGIDGKC